MNFEDESYVRLYKRKTVTSKLIGWEGRACLAALLIEVDRAGVLDLEGMDPADALAAMADMPIEIVRVGMARLLERGVVIVHDGQLFLPRFLEAQEARQSDAQRQRESRAKRAARSDGWSPTARVTLPESESQSVTERDHMTSQDVTSCHDVTPPVTPCHSVLSSAQLSSAVLSFERGANSSSPEPTDPKPAASAAEPKRPRRWTRVPESWQPKPEHVGLAINLGVPLEEEVLKFKDHEYKNPKSDADACFRTWLRNSPGLRRQAIAKRGPVQNNHGQTGFEAVTGTK